MIPFSHYCYRGRYFLYVLSDGKASSIAVGGGTPVRRLILLNGPDEKPGAHAAHTSFLHVFKVPGPGSTSNKLRFHKIKQKKKYLFSIAHDCLLGMYICTCTTMHGYFNNSERGLFLISYLYP